MASTSSPISGAREVLVARAKRSRPNSIEDHLTAVREDYNRMKAELTQASTQVRCHSLPSQSASRRAQTGQVNANELRCCHADRRDPH